MPLRAQGEEEPIGKGRGLGEDLTNKPGTPHKHLGSCCPLYFWPNLKIVMKPLLSLRETASTWPSWKLSYLTVEHETPARQIYGFCQHFPVPCLLFPPCCHHDLLTSVYCLAAAHRHAPSPEGCAWRLDRCWNGQQRRVSGKEAFDLTDCQVRVL